MKIKLINHSSIQITYKSINIICDPWIEKPVFNEGWDLLVKTKFKFSDFKKITHIWISHEHPDHFHPYTLTKINIEDRKNITIFYKDTDDKRVINFLKKLSFKSVIEMKEFEPYYLLSDFFILSGFVGNDSWLYVKGCKSMLNINDCGLNDIKSLKKIKDIIGYPDMLLTQFSYGQYEGESDQPEKKQLAIDKKNSQNKLRIDYLKPKYIIPFASYVYFCNSENFHMNSHINTVQSFYDLFNTKSNNVIPLYINESFDLDNPVSNSLKSLHNWENAYNLDDKVKIYSKTKNVKDIEDEIKRFNKKLLYKPLFYPFLIYLEKMSIKVNDLNVFFVFNKRGLKRTKKIYNNPDIIISSDSLFFCLKEDYGFNTLYVNARIKFSSNESIVKFKKIENLMNLSNHSRSNSKILKTMFKRIKNKFNFL